VDELAPGLHIGAMPRITVGTENDSPASHACVDTWLTDFHGDLPKIDVPSRSAA
jgi:hypothetical protein